DRRRTNAKEARGARRRRRGEQPDVAPVDQLRRLGGNRGARLRVGREDEQLDVARRGCGVELVELVDERLEELGDGGPVVPHDVDRILPTGDATAFTRFL